MTILRLETQTATNHVVSDSALKQRHFFKQGPRQCASVRLPWGVEVRAWQVHSFLTTGVRARENYPELQSACGHRAPTATPENLETSQLHSQAA